MKLQSFTSAIAASIITFVWILATNNHAQAYEPPTAPNVTFFCGMKDGIPHTSARTSQGTFSIIEWRKEYYPESNEDPIARCMRVSGIIQTYNQQGILNYITTGEMNGQRVICATTQEGSKCSRLLYKLEQDEYPTQEVEALLAVLRSPSVSRTEGGAIRGGGNR
jgi:hypothetical protein